MEKKKIAIFGATGLIGTYTAVHLKALGYDVIAIGKRKGDNGFFNDHGMQYHSVDIANSSDFSKLPANVWSVINFAGMMPASMKGYTPQLYIDSVLSGTLNVLNYCVYAKAEKIIFSHSTADSKYLYGKTPIPSDIVKKFPLADDHSVYAICKNAAVDLIEHFYYRNGLKRFILRLPTIYAYHPNPYFYVDGERKMQAWRFIIKQAQIGETIEIWGDPARAKEIVYVKDFTQIIQKCIESHSDGGVYNVGRGVGVTLEEQVRGIIDVFSKPGNMSKITYRPDRPNTNEFIKDISKTKAELGYQPMYNYHDLLVDIKKHMEEEPFKLLWGGEDEYEKAIN